MRFPSITINTLAFLLVWIICLPVKCQVLPKKIVDFECVKQAGKLPCGFKVQIGTTREYRPMIFVFGQRSGENAGDCVSITLVTPPPQCVSTVYRSSDVDAMLATQMLATETLIIQQARAARLRELALCKKLAPKPSDCDELVPAAD